MEIAGYTVPNEVITALARLVAALLLAILVALFSHLMVRITSKRVKLAKAAYEDFINDKKHIDEKPIEINSSARNKRDLDSWDFTYQKNRWLAENDNLVTEYSKAYQWNSHRFVEILDGLQKALDRFKKLPFYLGKIEAAKIAKILKSIDFPSELILNLSANYTSPAGRINLDKTHIYKHSLEDFVESTSVGGGKGTETVFRDAKDLQFPGVYVYTYPNFMVKDIFPLKIGKSESSVYARVMQQIANGGAAIPEAPVIICAIRLDEGAGRVESLFHANFTNRKTKGGGIEWFTVSLEELRQEITARGYSAVWNPKYSTIAKS